MGRELSFQSYQVMSVEKLGFYERMAKCNVIHLVYIDRDMVTSFNCIKLIEIF